MPTRKRRAKIDPELTRQIDKAALEVSAHGGTVEAVVMLRQTPDQIAADPDRTEALALEILNRVKERVGSGAKTVNVFRNLGSFVVAADPGFLRELVAQPEIASALANRRPQEAPPPVDKPPAVKTGSKRGRAK